MFNFPPRTEENFGWYCVLLAIILTLTYIPILVSRCDIAGTLFTIGICSWGIFLLWCLK